MNKPPHAVQLSRFKAPTIRRGRAYTVDFGIAKPLYKQVLSSLASQASAILKASSGAHPRWRLITPNKLRLTFGLVAFYMAVFLPMTAHQKIVYADPLINPPKLQRIQPLAQLVMPAVTPVEPVSELPVPPPPITAPAAPNSFYNAYTPGQCTAGIAGRIHVPDNLGNAGDWAANARADGYAVGYTPVVGTVAQTSGDSYLGHVALVEAVYGDGTFLIWEMNGMYGPFTTDERVTTTAEFQNFIQF